MLHGSRKWGFFIGMSLVVSAQPPGKATVFHASTRLVEVQVTVRNQRVRPQGVRGALVWALDSGPPFGPAGTPLKGLTKDDFTLLDQGKPQRIAVFSAQPPHEDIVFTPPPGTVSNRTNHQGQPHTGTTAILVDLLNTPWALTDYARLGLTEFLRTLKDTESPIALYSLGKDLHVLHDFTDDPQKLRDAAAMLDQPDGHLPPDFSTALRDWGDLASLDNPGLAADIHGRITLKALTSIIQHLSGVPGRKNLVWLAQAPWIPPRVTKMMQQANVVLYPVRVRGLGGFADLEGEVSRVFGKASGGRGFFDARDLVFAVQTATEDLGSAYTLGFYPSDEMLDGKFHKITVKLADSTVELHYRSGYLATKDEVPSAVDAPSLAELLEDPIDSTGLGLAAQAIPQDQRPGLCDVRITVNLHDVKLKRIDRQSVGALDFATPSAYPDGTIKGGSVAINLADDQLVSTLEHGFTFVIRGVEANLGEVRLVVRDHTTGIAGSLRVPITKQ